MECLNWRFRLEKLWKLAEEQQTRKQKRKSWKSFAGVTIFFSMVYLHKGKPVSPWICVHQRIHATSQNRNITQQLKYFRRVKYVLCEVNIPTSNRYIALQPFKFENFYQTYFIFFTFYSHSFIYLLHELLYLLLLLKNISKMYCSFYFQCLGFFSFLLWWS